jgi:hypothetical protein
VQQEKKSTTIVVAFFVAVQQKKRRRQLCYCRFLHYVVTKQKEEGDGNNIVALFAMCNETKKCIRVGAYFKFSF